MFLPGESQGLGAWWGAVHGVAQSRTQLKRLSSSSSKLPLGLPWWLSGKESACQTLQEMLIGSLGRENPLEEKMATHSSILDWEIPWT